MKIIRVGVDLAKSVFQVHGPKAKDGVFANEEESIYGRMTVEQSRVNS